MALTELLPQKKLDKAIPQPFVDTTGEFQKAFEAAKLKELEAREQQRKKALEKPKNIKKYLLCVIFNETETWDVQEVVGQHIARENLIDMVDEIDLERSFVLVEDVPFGEGKVSVYDFLVLIEKNYSDGFDVRDHLLHPIKREEEIEQEEEEDKKANLWANGDAPETYEKFQQNIAYTPIDAKEIR
jgi:hypothetical protein